MEPSDPMGSHQRGSPVEIVGVNARAADGNDLRGAFRRGINNRDRPAEARSRRSVFQRSRPVSLSIPIRYEPDC